MKRLAYLSGIAGLLWLTALIAQQGWPALLQALTHAGWPLLWLVPAHLVPLALDTHAWRVLLKAAGQAWDTSFSFLLWVAAIREAVNRLLPVIGVGGEVVGIRLCRWRMADTTAVTATVIVEVLITIVGQYLFCGMGIVLMMRLTAGAGQIGTILFALLLSLPLPVLIYLLLRHGAVFSRMEDWAKRLLGSQSHLVLRLDGAGLDAKLHLLFRQPWQLLSALTWQFAGFLTGAFETWFALRLLGHPVDVGVAIAIEALSQAVRHATFIVPAGIGAQEAAVMLFGYLAGVDGNVALSLALIKRARELLFGVPVLLWWQGMEARQLRRARAVPEPNSDSA